MKFIRTLALALAFILASCASFSPKQTENPILTLTFQNGQTANLELNNTNPEIRDSFLGFVRQGVYSQTPVYRQLPGIFILTGKPRLKGEGYISGPSAPLEVKNAHYGQAGLVVHADGTVGPELILVYGVGLSSCCEAPQNVAIGSITSGKRGLGTVLRGDNLQSIAIQP